MDKVSKRKIYNDYEIEKIVTKAKLLGRNVIEVSLKHSKRFFIVHIDTGNTMVLLPNNINKLESLKELMGLRERVEVIGGSGLVNTDYLFYINKAYEIDVSNLDTKNVESMDGMFDNCSSYITGLELLNTSKVKNFRFMFNSSSIRGNVGSFDTANVNNFFSMFYSSNIKDIGKLNFNTSNVINMTKFMYNGVTANLDISSFDLSNVKKATDMFRYSIIGNLRLGKFNIDLRNVGDIFGSASINNLYTSNKKLIQLVKTNYEHNVLNIIEDD